MLLPDIKMLKALRECCATLSPAVQERLDLARGLEEISRMSKPYAVEVFEDWIFSSLSQNEASVRKAAVAILKQHMHVFASDSVYDKLEAVFFDSAESSVDVLSIFNNAKSTKSRAVKLLCAALQISEQKQAMEDELAEVKKQIAKVVDKISDETLRPLALRSFASPHPYRDNMNDVSNFEAVEPIVLVFSQKCVTEYEYVSSVPVCDRIFSPKCVIVGRPKSDLQ